MRFFFFPCILNAAKISRKFNESIKGKELKSPKCKEMQEHVVILHLKIAKIFFCKRDKFTRTELSIQKKIDSKFVEKPVNERNDGSFEKKREK